MSKKILAIVLALVMCLTLLPVTALAADKEHTHDDITFKAWASETELPNVGGNYYLTKDVTLSATWTVPAATTTNLCLNGHVIQRSGTGSAIYVFNGATLNLYDCDARADEADYTHAGYVDTDGLWHLGTGEGTSKNICGGVITGGNTTDDGGGLYIEIGGSVEMTGGTISGNTADYGGGVYVYNGGRFEMSGGMISGNTAGNGGGVDVHQGSFEMTDGTISGNKATTGGGGVYVFTGSVEMTGGIISSNTAGFGGGVCVDRDGYFTLTGGTISGNTAQTGGGVCLVDTLTIGGTAVIKNNIDAGEKANDTECYEDNGTITISADTPPASGMCVGLLGVVGDRVGNATSGDEQYFFSDNPDYYVAYNTADGGYLELKAPVAGVEYTVNISSGAGGVVYTGKQVASATSLVTLTVVPEEGYQLKSLTVNSSTDGITDKGEGKYEFTMPNANVTVTAVFEELGDEDSGCGLLRLLRAALVTKLTVCSLVRGVTAFVRLTARIAAAENATIGAATRAAAHMAWLANAWHLWH